MGIENIVLFILSFIIILAACELFTNGVEWIGRRFELSEGTIGSVLAAVGTALPETLIPLIAILFLGGSTGSQIGTGAILGAPFMLATLALFVCGISVIAFRKRRGTGNVLRINKFFVRKDIAFFLLAYSLAAVAAFLPTSFNWFRLVLGLFLIPLYGVYLWYTVKCGGQCEEELKDLYIRKWSSRKEKGEPRTWLIVFQTLIGLAGIIGGAYLFVIQVQTISESINLDPVVLALLVSPIATELPEKFNSMLWIHEKKDTYAIGNITGAMVFQSCIPVTIGLLLTNWHIDITGGPTQVLEAATILIALTSGLLLLYRSKYDEIKASWLMIGGAFYMLFLVLVFLLI